jgi:phosphoserine aminotransferase
MSRKFNFCAGPAALPEAVLLQAQQEMLDWQGRGLSIMEMSHRSSEMMSVAAEAENDLRDLLHIPENYKVLFLQGGASMQFSAVPLNLLPVDGKADYLITGQWSKKAHEEAARLGEAHVVATSKGSNFSTIPAQANWQLNKNAAYLHYTPNETIGGVEFHWTPEVDGVPLVADMSSTILSRPIDVSQFGVIYAGAQKNIGPAGLAIVIVREDLLGRSRADIPKMLDWKTAADNDSMYNTPPTYSWYLAGLVFKWLKAQGGVEGIAKINQRKAEKLYSYIDNSGFYKNPVELQSRSWMNVPFTLPNESLDKPFLQEAEDAGLLNLKGHRSVGGMRASLYNAISEEAVDALITHMQHFAQRHA